VFKRVHSATIFWVPILYSSAYWPHPSDSKKMQNAPKCVFFWSVMAFLWLFSASFVLAFYKTEWEGSSRVSTRPNLDRCQDLLFYKDHSAKPSWKPLTNMAHVQAIVPNWGACEEFGWPQCLTILRLRQNCFGGGGGGGGGSCPFF